MAKHALHQLVEFARTIRFSHTLFAMPFALGTALLAAPPYPDGWSLALLVACMVAARTAAMGFNRVADAAIDARNPRTAGRAIPAGRLGRRAALAMALASGAAFVAMAWLFLPLRGNVWPGLLAAPFLAVLMGYSWTKRFTILTHWMLGLSLGLAPVGAWIALRGEIALAPVLIGAAVMFWTAGFDILYALQDAEVDRREGLRSVPARFGPAAARWLAIDCHAVVLPLLAAVPGAYSRTGRPYLLASVAAVALIAAAMVIQHLRARRATAAAIAADFFPVNAFVSIIWLAGVVVDIALSRQIMGWLAGSA
jgi:4-hydroxybenzoate polyprenyltransferase